MEKSLPIILSELRKAKGISQKNAAAQLGISQALLSHYEKGIRECGIGFLVKAADFYGVSCDYLLGRTNSPSGLNSMQAEAQEEDTDTLPIIKTFLKAAAQLKDLIYQSDSEIALKLDAAYALELYRITLMYAEAGSIPKSWAGNSLEGKKLFGNSFYLNLINSAEDIIIAPQKLNCSCEDAPVPDAVKTAISFAENCLHNALNKSVPSEFFK